MQLKNCIICFIGHILCDTMKKQPNGGQISTLFQHHCAQQCAPAKPQFFLSDGISVTLLFNDSFLGEIFSYYSSPSGVTLLPINPFNRTVTRHGKYRFADRAMTARNMLMSIKEQTLMTPYLQFDRNQWAALRDSVPMTLSEDEIARLKGINEDLSLEEVAEIYLPLSRLLNFYISSNLRRQAVLEQFLGTNGQRIPYIISIAGSVAVGKSTTARVLQALLSRWPEHRRVELITTDGFLHPNQVLKERGLMKKKGFPESYDMHRLVKFVSDLKSGVPNVTAPVYSHLIYDVIPDGDKTVVQPDILILEGLNVLQSGMDYPHDPHHVFVSDFVDFSIYVDAPEDLLQTWYINRFLKFREGAFTDPDSYFHNYAKLTKEEAIKTAMTLWKEINWLNLKQNILPTRERASLILTKSANHAVEEVRLRK